VPLTDHILVCYITYTIGTSERCTASLLLGIFGNT